MAKALIGHLPGSSRPSNRPAVESHRLRRRVAELESLVLRLQQENDRLTALQAAAMLEGADLHDHLPDDLPDDLDVDLAARPA
jgi:hypothetical protein